MTTMLREYTHDDAESVASRAKWGRGPWSNEPDKIQWVDDATGLDCLIHRNHSGALCGYVGVTEGHPCFGIDYSGCTQTPHCGESYCGHSPDNRVEVHGGLTYADFCQDTKDEAVGICHLPFEGRPHRVWWLGFDCAHSFDLIPGMRDIGLSRGVYRDRAYVEGQCRKLAAQLHEMAQAK